jgi:hypothetical protein
MKEAAVYSEMPDVDSRLLELGLTVNVLHEAIRIGEVHRRGCTLNDPLSVPGIVAWARTVRGLRELLLPDGWTRFDDHKIPLVRNPTKEIAIAVATGNAGTGNIDVVSKTKYPKGPATIAAVKQNVDQLAFEFYHDMTDTISQKQTSDCLTWVLLFSRCRDEIRCELSLPSKIGEDGRLENWDERIILPSIPIDIEVSPKFHEEEGADIVVEVSRRITQ